MQDQHANTGAVQCYAIRRVNPFIGVLQVVKTAGGRAISTNGIVWDIEIRVDDDDEWGVCDTDNKQAAYYRYGLWSLEEGLASRPLASQPGNDSMAQKSEVIIACISDHLDKLPFVLEDKIELWLFDKDGIQPLTLLATSKPGSKRPTPSPRFWSACIGATGVPSQRRFPGVNELEDQVKKRAGFNIQSQWVVRQQDGSGVIEKTEQVLGSEAFPPYLVTEDWPDEKDKALVKDYIKWIAPSLLTLQHYTREQRHYLELSLNIQAISVEHHWHLYPEVIDEQRIKAARVQCSIEKANK
jgi:hypothetical protein